MWIRKIIGAGKDTKRHERTPLRDDFSEARVVWLGEKKVAVVVFRGEAATTHELMHVFSAMDKAIEELLERERPAGLVLDFRELKYEWGDEMARTLSVPSTWSGGEFPVVVVTSEINEAGLRSLVRDELFSDPAEWLAETEERALEMIRRKIERTIGQGR